MSLSNLFNAGSKPKSNTNDRSKLRSASMSIGDDSAGDEIDDTTIAVVLETLFVNAVKEWCEENQEKLLSSPAALDALADAASEAHMNIEFGSKTKKAKKM